MILTLAKTLLFTIIGLLLAWGFTLSGASEGRTLEEELLHVSDAVDDPAILDNASGWGFAGTHLVESARPHLGPTLGVRIHHGAGVAGVHVALVLAHLPSLLIVASGAWALGLWARERTRHGTTYASPTRAYLSKHLAIASALTLGLFALSPLPLPLWTLWACTITFALGGGLYVANLPIRL